MSILEKRIPDSAIPALHDNWEFKKWYAAIEDKMKNDKWTMAGLKGLKELEMVFGLTPVEFCIDTIQEQLNKAPSSPSSLKIVSFGGAHLTAIIEMRRFIEEYFSEKKNEINIEIVDYSLKQQMGKQGLEKMGIDVSPADTDPLKRRNVTSADNKIRLHSGALELKDIWDAKDADLEISLMGPFFHGQNAEQIMEMIEKAITKLSEQGKAFFEISLTDEEIEKLRKRIPHFDVILKYDLGTRYLIISKKGQY